MSGLPDLSPLPSATPVRKAPPEHRLVQHVLLPLRAPRFGAWVTTAVLAVVLLVTGAAPTLGLTLLAAQTLVFALGTRGRNPYALAYKRFVRTPPTEREPAAPVRFAQGVGLGFAVVGTLALALGATTVGLVAVAMALAAALLNAAFGICLGCELYLIVKRVLPSAARTLTNEGANA